MKKMSIISVVLASVLLSGCFGITSITGSGGSGIQAVEGYTIYDGSSFKILVPAGWEIITERDLRSSMGQNVVAAFRNNVRNPEFTANVVIVKNVLTGEAKTIDYEKALYEKIKNSLSSFKELAYDTTQVRVGGTMTDTLFTDVQGREGPDRDLKRFMHLSGVAGTTAYVAAGSMLVGESVDTAKKIETMIRSFEVE